MEDLEVTIYDLSLWVQRGARVNNSAVAPPQQHPYPGVSISTWDFLASITQMS